MELVTLKDKQFKPFISAEKIADAVKKIASQMNQELGSEKPLFIGVLNGSFMFASDLMKEINIECEISFVKLNSYQGTQSSGIVSELIGLKDEIAGRNVVIIEDIIDTGNTIVRLVEILNTKKINSLKIASAFLKPSVYKKDIKIDYVGIEIPNDFVVGYGLDYDGLGRNLKDLLVIA